MSISKKQCIEEFQRLQSTLEDGLYVTRTMYRKYSSISERQYLKHFGSFTELKRQSLGEYKEERKLLSSVRRHSETDHLANMESDRLSWSDSFSYESSQRFQTTLYCSDIHDKDCDEFVRRTFLDTAKRLSPNEIVLGGDILDLPEFSKYTNDPRTYDVVERIKWLHEFLSDMREAAPQSKITWIEGNHEHRACRFLAENASPAVTILSDIHGWEFKDLFGLQKYELNYIGKGRLKAFNQKDIKTEIAKSYYMSMNSSLLFHHFPYARNWGVPGINGHNHRHEMWSAFSPIYGPWEWHQNGAGHQRYCSYGEGEIWGNGFMIVYTDTHKKRSQFEYIDVSHDMAIIGGKAYYRNDSERVSV